MGSTRKKNGGKKKTLKYGGRRNNYKKGSFKNRRKMTIRNGEGLKGGMYRFKDENNFKKTDSEDTIRDKLTRMYTRKIGRQSDLRDYMEASWERYLLSISKADRTKMEELARNVAETVKSTLPASSTARKSPSPSRGSAAAAASSGSLDDDDDDDEDALYRRMNQLVLTRSKKTREEYKKQLRQFRQITGKDPSSDEEMSDADLHAALADAVSGRRYPGFTADKAAEAELARIAEDLKDEDLKDELESEEH